MKIKEVMKREVISVKPTDNALDVLNLLFKMQISGLPVIDDQGKLVGMFTEKNVLSFILPSYIEKIGNFIYEEDPKSIKGKFAYLSKMQISQVMRRDVVTAREDSSLCEIAKDMLIRKARRIPVIDETGKVIGIVSRCDILKALSKKAEAAVNA